MTIFIIKKPLFKTLIALKKSSVSLKIEQKEHWQITRTRTFLFHFSEKIWKRARQDFRSLNRKESAQLHGGKREIWMRRANCRNIGCVKQIVILLAELILLRQDCIRVNYVGNIVFRKNPEKSWKRVVWYLNIRDKAFLTVKSQNCGRVYFQQKVWKVF